MPVLIIKCLEQTVGNLLFPVVKIPALAACRTDIVTLLEKNRRNCCAIILFDSEILPQEMFILYDSRNILTVIFFSGEVRIILLYF